MATHTERTARRSLFTMSTQILGLLQNFLRQWDKEIEEETPKRKSAQAHHGSHPYPTHHQTQKHSHPKRAKRPKRARAAAAAKSAQSRSEEAKAQAQTRSPETHSVIPNHNDVDPAHRPGHRTFDMKSEFPEHTGEKVHVQKSAMENFTDGDRAARVTSPQRQINSTTHSPRKKSRSNAKLNHH